MTEKDVLSDVELRNKAQLLTYETDAHGKRIARTFNSYRPDEVERNLALVRLHHAEHDFHQRRFTGAVLAQERVHLTGHFRLKSTPLKARTPAKDLPSLS